MSYNGAYAIPTTNADIPEDLLNKIIGIPFKIKKEVCPKRDLFAGLFILEIPDKYKDCFPTTDILDGLGQQHYLCKYEIEIHYP